MRAGGAAAFRPHRQRERGKRKRTMSVATTATTRESGRWLPLRFALREMRGGLRGFYVFIACIALGAMAIAGVGSLAASLASGLAREGQVILGGDLSFTLIQREAAPNERAFLQSHGKLSSAATLRAICLLYTSPSPRDRTRSRMPSSA